MTIRELDEQAIMKSLEEYDKIHIREKRKQRKRILLFAVILLAVYLYLRFFNTGIEVGNGWVRLKYSTAWVVNCPANLWKMNDKEDVLLDIGDLTQCSHMRVLIVGEGIEILNGSLYEDRSRKVKLETVQLPSTLTYIDYSAFEDISTLKTVVWEKVSDYATIANDAFAYTSIEELEIPEGVKEIGDNAFANNDALVKVVLPDSIEKMSDGVFKNCNELREVTWTNSLSMIPEDTFMGCDNLTTINNAEAIKEVMYNAFSDAQKAVEQFLNNKAEIVY